MTCAHGDRQGKCPGKQTVLRRLGLRVCTVLCVHRSVCARSRSLRYWRLHLKSGGAGGGGALKGHRSPWASQDSEKTAVGRHGGPRASVRTQLIQGHGQIEKILRTTPHTCLETHCPQTQTLNAVRHQMLIHAHTEGKPQPQGHNTALAVHLNTACKGPQSHPLQESTGKTQTEEPVPRF